MHLNSIHESRIYEAEAVTRVTIVIHSVNCLFKDEQGICLLPLNS